MSTYAYAADANGMAGLTRARVRVFRSCQPVVAAWSPNAIALGTTVGHKHGPPRWTQESP